MNIDIKNNININRESVNQFLNTYLPKISADTLGWLAVVAISTYDWTIR